MNRLKSFILIVSGTYLQFIALTTIATSTNVLSARIAFGSTVLALAATIGSLKKLTDELTEAKCA